MRNSSTENLKKKIGKVFGWTRSSYILLGMFILIILLIIYIWWPLTVMVMDYIDWEGEWWLGMDWLLIGIFLFMTLVIMAGADLRKDALILLVGTIGGLVIESWGTQTYLWWYFTAQRPPLWIIPAWPIASLTIDRMVRFVNKGSIKANETRNSIFHWLYWFIFPSFLLMMVWFAWPVFEKPLTWLAFLLVFLLIISPNDKRVSVLTFLAGAGLGYFLEYWGTTRECWTYYTFQKPPLFAVLAHGMAAVAFWRSSILLISVGRRILSNLFTNIKDVNTGYGAGSFTFNRE